MRHPVPIPGHPGPQQGGVVDGGLDASPMAPLGKLMVDIQPHPLCRRVILSRIWSVCVGWSVVGTGQEMQGQRVTLSLLLPTGVLPQFPGWESGCFVGKQSDPWHSVLGMPGMFVWISRGGRAGMGPG